jgi:archaellum component FlaC
MSGKNPFWNYDYNAAQRNREIVDSYQQANEATLNSQQAQFEASMANDRVSRIQVQLNNTINSHKKAIADYEQRLEEQKAISFKLIMKVNIFERTLNRIQEQWPEKKESILDEIQHQKDYCSVEEYKEKWWKWVNDGGLTPEANCLKFPYPEREIKNKT